MIDEPQEAECVARVAEGDRAAFARLVGLHLKPIEAYAMRMTGNPAQAQDIAQEVMLRLWLRAGDYDPKRARLTTWLHRIAHNLCLDYFREGARLFSDSCASDSYASDSYASVIDAEDRTRNVDVQTDLARGLAALPERQRNALVLTYYQELPNRDAAAIMGLRIRAPESLLVRARSALRSHLETVA